MPLPASLTQRPEQPHPGCLFLQVGLQVTPAVVPAGSDHHLMATTGPWGDKEQPQAHILPGNGVMRAGARPMASKPAPTLPWPCLLKSHPMGPQLQDTTEEGVVRAQGDEAWFR